MEILALPLIYLCLISPYTILIYLICVGVGKPLLLCCILLNIFVSGFGGSLYS